MVDNVMNSFEPFENGNFQIANPRVTCGYFPVRERIVLIILRILGVSVKKMAKERRFTVR